MQELDNLVKSLEKNIRISLEKITNLQKLNFELESELNLLKKKDLEKSNLIDLCEEKYKSLKIANTILGSDNGTKDTKLEINSLIREIDYCISQLTE
ncbi:MAG: hypothetical protein EVA45_01415 [Flavobacteriales bacterium]|jgi:hypothetical protein|nr:MAG: hypothetical protein EVA45_01415 [Flavobacteriales bacterium]|tara:strand:+ start:672 stop:962 length:291 start_codon:yes stop_codon:yes gene_type:complete